MHHFTLHLIKHYRDYNNLHNAYLSIFYLSASECTRRFYHRRSQGTMSVGDVQKSRTSCPSPVIIAGTSTRVCWMPSGAVMSSWNSDPSSGVQGNPSHRHSHTRHTGTDLEFCDCPSHNAHRRYRCGSCCVDRSRLRAHLPTVPCS